MVNKKKSYWNDRAKGGKIFKNEYFYTITPLPLYIDRRKWLYNKISKAIRNKAILDFGCGEGHFSRFAIKSGAKCVLGIDTSEVMLQLAEKYKNSSKIKYSPYDGSVENLKNILITDFGRVDITIILLTSAHIKDDNQVIQYLSCICKYTQAKELIIFEACIDGEDIVSETVVRRNKDKIIKLASKAGWSFCSFDFYNTTAFDKLYGLWQTIRSIFWRFAIKKNTNQFIKETRNDNLDIFISKIFIIFNKWINKRGKRGNCLYAFKRGK